MCSAALYLAVATLAKKKLHKDWHWGIYWKLKRSIQNRKLPAFSLPEERAHPARVTHIAQVQDARTDGSSSVPPHSFQNTSVATLQSREIKWPVHNHVASCQRQGTEPPTTINWLRKKKAVLTHYFCTKDGRLKDKILHVYT